MPKKYDGPTRMCIGCRERFLQSFLLRLICTEKSLHLFSGSGRSFYLCSTCLEDEKKVTKSLMRQCKTGDATRLFNQLKEIAVHNGKS